MIQQNKKHSSINEYKSVDRAWAKLLSSQLYFNVYYLTYVMIKKKSQPYLLTIPVLILICRNLWSDMAVDCKIVCFLVLMLLYGRRVQMELSADELLQEKSISMK